MLLHSKRNIAEEKFILDYLVLPNLITGALKRIKPCSATVRRMKLKKREEAFKAWKEQQPPGSEDGETQLQRMWLPPESGRAPS
jgi:hypothetical protein